MGRSVSRIHRSRPVSYRSTTRPPPRPPMTKTPPRKTVAATSLRAVGMSAMRRHDPVPGAVAGPLPDGPDAPATVAPGLLTASGDGVAGLVGPDGAVWTQAHDRRKARSDKTTFRRITQCGQRWARTSDLLRVKELL